MFTTNAAEALLTGCTDLSVLKMTAAHAMVLMASVFLCVAPLSMNVQVTCPNLGMISREPIDHKRNDSGCPEMAVDF